MTRGRAQTLAERWCNGHGFFRLYFEKLVQLGFSPVKYTHYPPTRDLHLVLEAHCEYGPVGAIWLEIGDAGGESFNDGHDVAGGLFSSGNSGVGA